MELVELGSLGTGAAGAWEKVVRQPARTQHGIAASKTTGELLPWEEALGDRQKGREQEENRLQV